MDESKKPALLWKRRAGTTMHWDCSAARETTRPDGGDGPVGVSSGMDGRPADGAG